MHFALYANFMPELPEVETIRLQLQSVKGKKIAAVRVIFGRKIKPAADDLVKLAKGAVIKEIGRRAKLLLIHLSSGYTLVIHLKMSGRILLGQKKAAPSKHAFVVFILSDGRQIFWEDIRKFGFLKIMKTAELKKYWQEERYGLEPLEKNFTSDVLRSCLAKKRGKRIKSLLMEQTCVAGLGNIYAAETLWYAGIRPSRKAGDLKDAEIKRLHEGIKKILASAINLRGTSADAYVDFFGEQGEYMPKLRVYGREGEKCLRRDGGIIKKIKLGGRGTYFCPYCQK